MLNMTPASDPRFSADALRQVSTDDLIAGNHFTDVDLFRCFMLVDHENNDRYCIQRRKGNADDRTIEEKLFEDKMGKTHRLDALRDFYTVQEASDEPHELDAAHLPY